MEYTESKHPGPALSKEQSKNAKGSFENGTSTNIKINVHYLNPQLPVVMPTWISTQWCYDLCFSFTTCPWLLLLLLSQHKKLSGCRRSSCCCSLFSFWSRCCRFCSCHSLLLAALYEFLGHSLYLLSCSFTLLHLLHNTQVFISTTSSFLTYCYGSVVVLCLTSAHLSLFCCVCFSYILLSQFISTIFNFSGIVIFLCLYTFDSSEYIYDSLAELLFSAINTSGLYIKSYHILYFVKLLRLLLQSLLFCAIHQYSVYCSLNIYKKNDDENILFNDRKKKNYSDTNNIINLVDDKYDKKKDNIIVDNNIINLVDDKKKDNIIADNNIINLVDDKKNYNIINIVDDKKNYNIINIVDDKNDINNIANVVDDKKNYNIINIVDDKKKNNNIINLENNNDINNITNYDKKRDNIINLVDDKKENSNDINNIKNLVDDKKNDHNSDNDFDSIITNFIGLFIIPENNKYFSELSLALAQCLSKNYTLILFFYYFVSLSSFLTRC